MDKIIPIPITESFHAEEGEWLLVCGHKIIGIMTTETKSTQPPKSNDTLPSAVGHFDERKWHWR